MPAEVRPALPKQLPHVAAGGGLPLPGGESLRSVQERNIAALTDILTAERDKTVVVGTHGTALSTILN